MENNNLEKEVQNIKKNFSLAQKIVLLNDKNDVLLVKVDNDKKWDLPGGHFTKDDESQLEALKREVAEEIGNSVDFKILDEVSVGLRKWKGEFVNIKVVYLAKYNLGKIKLSDEHSEFEWMSFKAVGKLKDEDCKEWLKDVVEKARVRLSQSLSLNSEVVDNGNDKRKALKVMLTIKGVVVNKKNEVLLLRRSENEKYNVGLYDLPGGYLDENEKIEDALIREIKEETGFEIEDSAGLLCIKDFKQSDKIKGVRFVVRYLGDDFNSVKLDEEHDEFVWLSFGEAIKKLDNDNDYEQEKKETIILAKEYLEREDALAGWRRTLADFDNYKKRALEREREFNQYASEGVINEMLPVLDNFHAATEHIPEADQDNPWVTGIMYIQKQMDKVFEDNGVSEIEVNIGDEFNPETMEAMKDENEEDKDGVKKVVKVSQKGYKIKDKIMRPAKVVVS